MKHRPEVEKIFRREMLKLRSEYITHHLAQIETLRSVLQYQTGSRLEPEGLTQLFDLTHRLRGSGQTYDLPDLTHGAGILEGELRTVIDNQGQLSDEERRTLLSQIDQLISLLKLERETVPSSPHDGESG